MHILVFSLTYNSVQSGASVSVQAHILVFSITYNSVQSGASVSVQAHILVFSGWATYNSVLVVYRHTYSILLVGNL